MKNYTFQIATKTDLPAIAKFVDFWLSGRAKDKAISGGSSDCFISHPRHKDYFRKYYILLCFYKNVIVGWAVMSKSQRLFHLLIAADHRGKGIGSRMLQILKPDIVRSKVDQGTGNPTEWYEKHGFKKEPGPLQGKNNNIQILMKG